MYYMQVTKEKRKRRKHGNNAKIKKTGAPEQTQRNEADIRISIVGNNQAGFSFAFVADEATQVDVEFKAHPMDDEGTLIYYEEVINPSLKSA